MERLLLLSRVSFIGAVLLCTSLSSHSLSVPLMSAPSLQDILNEADDDNSLLASLNSPSQPTANQLLFSSPTEAASDPFSGLLLSSQHNNSNNSHAHHSSNNSNDGGLGLQPAAPTDPFSDLLPNISQPPPHSGRLPPSGAAPLQPLQPALKPAAAHSTLLPHLGPDPFAVKAQPLGTAAAAADPFSDLLSLSASSAPLSAAAAAPKHAVLSGLPPSLASLPSVSAGRPSAPVLSLTTLNTAAAGDDSTASSALSSGVSSPLSASSPSLPHSASVPLSPYSTSAATAQDRQLLQSILSEQQAADDHSSAHSAPSGRPSAVSSSSRRVTPLTAAEIAAISNPLKRAEALEQQKSLVGNYRLVEPLRAKREQMRAQPVHNILRLQPLAAMRAELERARGQLGEWTCAAMGQRYMAVGTARGCIIVFNHFEQLQCVLGKPAEDVRTRGPVTCIDMNPTGDQVVAGHARGVCAVWDIATRKEVKDIKDASTRPITHVKFTKRGRPVFVAVDDQGIVTLFTLNKVSILSATASHNHNTAHTPQLYGAAGGSD